MRAVIAGSRGFGNRKTEDGLQDIPYREQCFGYMAQVLHPYRDDIEAVLSGGAAGADAMGERYAKLRKKPLEIYKADWHLLGKRAGFQRNIEMALRADVLFAFWDGESRGTRHMIELALEHGLEVHVFRYDLDLTEEA